jgi:hypothetical protein
VTDEVIHMILINEEELNAVQYTVLCSVSLAYPYHMYHFICHNIHLIHTQSTTVYLTRVKMIDGDTGYDELDGACCGDINSINIGMV